MNPSVTTQGQGDSPEAAYLPLKLPASVLKDLVYQNVQIFFHFSEKKVQLLQVNSTKKYILSVNGLLSLRLSAQKP